MPMLSPSSVSSEVNSERQQETLYTTSVVDSVQPTSYIAKLILGKQIKHDYDLEH